MELPIDEFANNECKFEIEFDENLLNINDPLKNPNKNESNDIKIGSVDIKTELIDEHYVKYEEHDQMNQNDVTDVKIDRHLKLIKLEDPLTNENILHTEIKIEPDEMFETVDKNQFKCDVCSKSFVSVAYLNIHQRIHGNEHVVFQCNKCSKSFTDANVLKSHLKTHINKRSMVCSFCPKKFFHRANLILHQQQIHRVTQKIAEHNVRTENTYSTSLPTYPETYSCKLGDCSAVFNRLIALQRHNEIHIGKNQFRCEVCAKICVSVHYLKQHKQLHDANARIFKCNVCTMKFTQSYALKRHERVHARDNLVSCEICSRTFTSLGHLNVHKKIHSDRRPFKCDLCSETFCFLNYYEKHRRNEHTNCVIIAKVKKLVVKK